MGRRDSCGRRVATMEAMKKRPDSSGGANNSQTSEHATSRPKFDLLELLERFGGRSEELAGHPAQASSAGVRDHDDDAEGRDRSFEVQSDVTRALIENYLQVKNDPLLSTGDIHIYTGGRMEHGRKRREEAERSTSMSGESERERKITSMSGESERERKITSMSGESERERKEHKYERGE